MSTKHTPGPWRVYGSHLVIGRIGDGIADCNASTGKAEAEKQANAHLIAAAPELLEALKGALPTMDDAADDAKEKAELYPEWARVAAAFEAQCKSIRAAIAKAEGGRNE